MAGEEGGGGAGREREKDKKKSREREANFILNVVRHKFRPLGFPSSFFLSFFHFFFFHLTNLDFYLQQSVLINLNEKKKNFY